MYMLQISLVWRLPDQKIPRKNAHDVFLSHLDVVNVTVDCQFTPGQVLLLFLRVLVVTWFGGGLLGML